MRQKCIREVNYHMISEAKVITIQVELGKLDETMTKYAPDAGFVDGQRRL